jgi:hypothetical protein
VLLLDGDDQKCGDCRRAEAKPPSPGVEFNVSGASVTTPVTIQDPIVVKKPKRPTYGEYERWWNGLKDEKRIRRKILKEAGVRGFFKRWDEATYCWDMLDVPTGAKLRLFYKKHRKDLKEE